MDALSRRAITVFLALLLLDLLVRGWISKEAVGPVDMEHLSFDPAQVSTVEIVAGKDRLVLERTAKGFAHFDTVGKEKQMDRQRALTGEQSQEVDAFLQRICSMVREPLEGTLDAKDSIYGLDSERSVFIRLLWRQQGKNGKDLKPFTVRFGEVLPLNVMYVYASFEDKPGLFKVLKNYRESALSLLHRFIQPRL